MIEQRVTLYQRDGETPLQVDLGGGQFVDAVFSTEPGSPLPHLEWCEGLPDSRVMLADGRAVVGQMSCTILDNPAPGVSDQTRGMMTRLLATVGGESALARARARFEQRWEDGPWVPMQDGPIVDISLTSDAAGYTVTIKDERDATVDITLFRQATTSTVLPAGVRGGYGYPPHGQGVPLLPPTEPIVANYPGGGNFDFRYLWPSLVVGRRDGNVAPERLVLTEAMESALRQDVREMEPYEEEYAPGEFRTVHPVRVVYPDVAFLWRAVGAATWNVLENPIGAAGPLVQVTQGRVQGGRFGTELYRAAYMIQVANLGDGHPEGAPDAPPVLPVPGQPVEIMLAYRGQPSEAWPLHVEGYAWQIARDVYDGVHSGGQGRSRYDLAALQSALGVWMRFRITRPEPDARRWLEREIYRPCAAAPTLGPDLEIAPIRFAYPAIDVELVELNDSNFSDASWRHDGEEIINSASVTYWRDYLVPLLEEGAAGDRIASRRMTVTHKHAPSIVDVGQEFSDEMESQGLRAIGNAEGEPITGDLADESGHQAAAHRARMLVDRYRYGGQQFGGTYTGAEPLRVGDWCLVAESSVPDYQSRRRGANRLAQVVAVRPLDPIAFDLTLEDAGPYEQPWPQPELGAVSVDADGVVRIAVEDVPPGGEAAVYYAISNALPPNTSELWQFAPPRLMAPGIIETPPIPAGATPWVRARTEGPGRRPSAWTNAVTPGPALAVARILRARLYLNDSVPVVQWGVNAFTLGVRLHCAFHPDNGAEPTVWTTLDVPASAGTATLSVTVPEGFAVTVDLEPWTGWTGVAVTGTPGERIRRQAAIPAVDATPAIWDVRVEYLDTATARVTIGGRNAYAAEIHVHYTISAQETFPDPAAPPPADYVLVGANTLDLPRPLEDAETIGWLQLEARGEHGAPRGGAIRRRIDPHRAPAEPGPVGPEGPPGVSRKVEFRYLCATTQPGTPAGRYPAGWTLDPEECAATRWRIQADIDLNTDTLIGGWSTPVRDVGRDGAPGESDALLPQFDSLTDFPAASTGGMARVHLYGRVTAPAGETGALEVMTAPNSYESPNPASPPEGSVGIGAFPFPFGPDTVFNLTGGGTGNLLSGVAKHPGTPKSVYYRCALGDGRTSNWREYAIRGSSINIVDPSGNAGRGIIALDNLRYDPDARVNDYEIEDPSAWGAELGWSHTQASWIPGSGYAWGRTANPVASAVRNSARFPVRAGQQYLVSVRRVAGLGANGTCYPRLSYYDAAGAEFANSLPGDLPPNPGEAWQYVHVPVVVPDGAVTASVDAVAVNHTAGQWFVREFSAHEIITADLAAIGFLRSRHASIDWLEAEEVRTNTLVAAVVQALVMQVGWYIESSNYVPGQSGFRITGDGDADINSATIRGLLELVANSNSARVRFTNPDGSEYGRLESYLSTGLPPFRNGVRVVLGGHSAFQVEAVGGFGGSDIVSKFAGGAVEFNTAGGVRCSTVEMVDPPTNGQANMTITYRHPTTGAIVRNARVTVDSDGTLRVVT